MVSISLLQTLLFTVGPFLIPRLISYYRTQRTQSKSSTLPIQVLPRNVYPALNILFLCCALALISTLPNFSPENIFTLTSSRFQTPNDVLFVRLASLRRNKSLTQADNLLKPRLASTDARGLYLTYGPDVLTYCPFCNSDEPTTYFYYALPAILLPHLLHLFALGLATSAAISGKQGSRWRTIAVILGGGLALADCYFCFSFEWKSNARIVRPEELNHFYWRMRTYRGVAISVADAVLAGLIWAASTNRMFVVPVGTAERMETAMKVLENVRGRLGAVGIVRNVIVRDESMRKKGEAYWRREGQVMAEVMDEREVVEGMRSAMGSGRVNIMKVEQEARNYAEGVIGVVEVREEGT